MGNKGISGRAVLLGVLVDFGSSIVASLGMGVAMGIALVARGAPPEQLATLLQAPPVLVYGMVVGFGCTLLGGFVAGRVAKQAELLNGGVVGAVGIPLGLLLTWSFPLWYTVISLVGIVPVAVVGGAIARLTRRKEVGTGG